MRKLRNIAGAALAVSVWLGLSTLANATTLTIGDSNDLGLINPNHPADPTSSTTYVNILLGMAIPSGPTVNGPNTYTRTSNDPLGGVYPTAVFAAELNFTPDPTGGNSASFDLDGGYLYLLGKFDGPNFGSEVWYVGALTGPVTMPEFGNGSQYGLSHIYVFNPTGVPDGGTTLILLGFALGGLGVMQRFLKRQTSL